MTKKIHILFFLYRAKLNKKGKAPIYCRLTQNKKRRQFSTGFFIPPSDWEMRTNSVKSSNPLASVVNQKLAIIERKVLTVTLKHEVNEREYTLDEIWNEVNGQEKRNVKSFLQAFDRHNEEVERLVGKSYSIATYKKFVGIRNQLKEFIRLKYQQDDILLTNLKLRFLTDLEHHLMEKDMKQISINKTIQRARKIVRYAIAHDYLEKDPFLLFKPKSVRIDVVYLSPEELSKLENHKFDSDRLTKVRDCFVFCCYTGLPYREMADLREHHITKGFDGKEWIKIQRKKTHKPLMIPILPQAATILERYKSDVRKDGALLPVITNQKFNQYLKEIAQELGVKKKLTHHIARKTFASTVLLYNDVPMEIVSELLGHSDIKITQKHYAKVSNKKVSSQIDKLSDKLKGK